jgi:hypothetical protein
MQLHCRACDKLIPAADVNIELGIARCLACNEVFNVLDELEAAQRERLVVELPKRFTLENWGTDLVITRRWFTHGVWALLGFCIFWDGFLVAWYTAGLRMLFHGTGDAWGTWVMLLFPVLHVTVGIGLTYGVLCMFLNKTVIRVSGGELTVRHGPLPGTGNCQLFSADIKQVFCTEKRTRGDDSWHVTYNVIALKRDDSQVALVSGLEKLPEALFIEQQIERHLKIQDERVPGEVNPSDIVCRL